MNTAELKVGDVFTAYVGAIIVKRLIISDSGNDPKAPKFNVLDIEKSEVANYWHTSIPSLIDTIYTDIQVLNPVVPVKDEPLQPKRLLHLV